MTFPTIAQHAKLHNIIPDKKLGQNFIFDLSLCDKIVKSSNHIKDQIVLEVGPGPGGLTRAILSASPKKLIVIEKDRRCLALLEDIKANYSQLEIINADALNLKLSMISDQKITIIANLPYNIGTELLFRWLDELEQINSITIMLQKEVVDRICANPHSKSYGKLSIMCQLLCEVEKEFDVSPAAFYPPPKVTSSIVRLVPKDTRPDIETINAIRHIASIAFNQRRKMLKTSLKTLNSDIESILLSCGLDPQDRAENLTIEQYTTLAYYICHLGAGRGPVI